MSEPASEECLFCGIASGAISAVSVFQNDSFFAFLDNRPLFPGHVLLAPRAHFETLLDLPPELSRETTPLIQLLARAVELSMHAEGSFIAVNNRVSQSVPHLHIHIVPRRKRDGLKGFFWPRTKYQNDAAAESTAAAIRGAIENLLASSQFPLSASGEKYLVSGS